MRNKQGYKLMPVTCLTTMITMCPPSGLGTKPTVGFFLHLWYLLSTSVPFSLGASEDTLKEGELVLRHQEVVATLSCGG